MDILGFLLGQPLPSPDRGVDIASVDFNGVAASAGAFRRKDRRTAAEVGVEHDVVALGAIKYGVRNQCDWFHRGVRFQLFSGTATREAVSPGSIPQIGPVPAEAAELNVVGMRVFSALEHEHKLVAGPVELPHATVGFGPDAEI